MDKIRAKFFKKQIKTENHNAKAYYRRNNFGILQVFPAKTQDGTEILSIFLTRDLLMELKAIPKAVYKKFANELRVGVCFSAHMGSTLKVDKMLDSRVMYR